MFKRSTLWAALALVPMSPLAVLLPAANEIPHEPLLVYEITGGTLSGPIDRELILYGDGTARLSSSTSGIDGNCQYTAVESADALALFTSLAQDGAFLLEDQTMIISDVPLKTLTVMRPLTNARVHTYSWWIGEDSYGPIEQKLEAFVASAFPNF
jgi:hypothetical protein